VTSGEVPTLVLPAEEEDDAAALLGHVQELIFRHPVAAQAIFRAFVAEGRAFAHTEEGRGWADRLSRSDLVRQGRLVWEAVSLNALDDREDTVLPSALLDAFAKAISEADLHAVVESMVRQGVLRGAGGHAG
jgi:hypothetical protein